MKKTGREWKPPSSAGIEEMRAKMAKREKDFSVHYSDLRRVFFTVKAALDNTTFLSGFEIEITKDFAIRYSRFGLKTNVTLKQMVVFRKIARKLFLGLANGWEIEGVEEDGEGEDEISDEKEE